MAGRQDKVSRPEQARRGTRRIGGYIRSTVDIAINRGFLVGRQVLLGSIPGVVLGYNIGRFGRFVGSAYPLVVCTDLGVIKCSMDEVRLA